MATNDKIKSAIKDSEFREELEDLVAITERLKAYSRQLVFTIITAIVLFASYSFYHSLEKRKVENFSSSYSRVDVLELYLWIGTLSLLIFAILLLYQFNSVKRKGTVIYDELTDELDWGHKRREYIKRPPIETRIVIKEFLQNTDLPFTSGQSGQGLYLSFIFLQIIAVIVVKAL